MASQTASNYREVRGSVYVMLIRAQFHKFKEKVIRPWLVPSRYMEIDKTYNNDGYACLLELKTDPKVDKVFDLPKDIIVLRSYLLPWRKFYYLDLGSSEKVHSSFYMLYLSPFYIKDTWVGTLLGPDDFGSKMLKHYNNCREVNSTWFSPTMTNEPFRFCTKVVKEDK